MNEKALQNLTQRAYACFYPLVTMGLTRLQFIYQNNKASPPNTLNPMWKFPSADYKLIKVDE